MDGLGAVVGEREDAAGRHFPPGVFADPLCLQRVSFSAKEVLLDFRRRTLNACAAAAASAGVRAPPSGLFSHRTFIATGGSRAKAPRGRQKEFATKNRAEHFRVLVEFVLLDAEFSRRRLGGAFPTSASPGNPSKERVFRACLFCLFSSFLDCLQVHSAPCFSGGLRECEGSPLQRRRLFKGRGILRGGRPLSPGPVLCQGLFHGALAKRLSAAEAFSAQTFARASLRASRGFRGGIVGKGAHERPRGFRDGRPGL